MVRASEGEPSILAALRVPLLVRVADALSWVAAIHPLLLGCGTASDLMTPKPFTITSNDPLSRAAELMIEHGISDLRVTDPKGKVCGIVAKRDIVRAIVK